MKILHLLDHSIPLHSGYTFRSLAILQEQRRLGWETYHLTSSKHQGAVADEEDCEGFHFYRTRERRFGFHEVPALRQWGVVRETELRLAEVIRMIRPDILHAHSPCLNGIAALRAARARGLPVQPLCASCHKDKSTAWPSSDFFPKVHSKHVTDKRLDCIKCHQFTSANGSN